MRYKWPRGRHSQSKVILALRRMVQRFMGTRNERKERKDSRNPKIVCLGTRQNDDVSDTRFRRKTEPVSRGEDVSCLGHPVLIEEFF